MLLRLPPDDELAQEIARRLDAREQPKAIAADLNERGVPKPIPSAWRGGNLTTLAARPTYAGLRVHQGRVLAGITGTWPPIITEAEHHQLVAMLADPERDRFRNSTAVKHLGTGIYRCGRDCTGRMRVMLNPGRPNSYICRDCHKVSRYQDPVDAIVEELVIERFSRPGGLAQLVQATGDDAEAQRASEEVARLKAKIADARRLVDEDKLSVESLSFLEQRTVPKIRAAQERARPRHVPASLFALAAAGSRVRATWKRMDIRDRRAAVDALMMVTILPAGRGSWRFDRTKVKVEWKMDAG